MQVQGSLMELFGDITYAWDLLESQVNLETNENVTGENVSDLLQLYMRGVEKMNSSLDVRESYFKNRVTALMSRPTVVRVLSRPMTKKNKVDEVETTPTKSSINKIELELQQKKQELEMRLAYSAEEHNRDALKKLMAEQAQKQNFLTSKIENIVNKHEERLMNRIRERKLKTMTAKSRSDIFINNPSGKFNEIDNEAKKQLMEKRRDEEQFGVQAIIQEMNAESRSKNRNRREYKSWSPSHSKAEEEISGSNIARRVSLEVATQIKVKVGKR